MAPTTCKFSCYFCLLLLLLTVLYLFFFHSFTFNSSILDISSSSSSCFIFSLPQKSQLYFFFLCGLVYVIDTHSGVIPNSLFIERTVDGVLEGFLHYAWELGLILRWHPYLCSWDCFDVKMCISYHFFFFLKYGFLSFALTRAGNGNFLDESWSNMDIYCRFYLTSILEIEDLIEDSIWFFWISLGGENKSWILCGVSFSALSFYVFIQFFKALFSCWECSQFQRFRFKILGSYFLSFFFFLLLCIVF